LSFCRRLNNICVLHFLGFELLAKDLTVAREEFRKARDAAQMAFGVVPETTDKILATKIMVTSAFYEFQDNIETARTFCAKYLDRMNSMPEVTRACEVMYTPQKSVAGRLLSMGGKAKRGDILQNAAEVNISVWNYMKEFLGTDFETPPAIRFGNNKVNPVNDLVLMRKPSIIAEVDKCMSNFISVCMTPDYIFAALGQTPELQETNAILALNLNTCKVTHLMMHEKTVMSVDYDGENLCSGSADKSIVIWDLQSLAPKRIIEEHEGSVRSLCHTDEYLISGSSDSTIRFWKRENNYECYKSINTGTPVMVVRASRRKFLFCITGVSTVQIWDTAKFVILHEINISSYGRTTVPNIRCPEVVANDSFMVVPVKSEDGEHVQCWNLGSLSLSGCIAETGHNIAKFHNNPYLFCGSDKVKMVSTTSYRTITEQEVVIAGRETTKRIVKMWTNKCYLYMLCHTDKDRFYIMRY